MSPDLASTHALFAPYLPEGTKLLIEVSECKCLYPVIMRLIYTSKKSGRTIGIMAKGDALPTADDKVLQFYVRQLVLTQGEILQEFSRVYFLERRAKQDAFLAGDRSVTVVDRTSALDRLTAEAYSPSAAADGVLNAA